MIKLSQIAELIVYADCL